MTLDYLPATLPPEGVVATLNPAAAEAIGNFSDYEATLPARRSDEQLNRLEQLRGQALAGLFDDEFWAALDAEEAELREAIAEQVAQLRTRWGRLEAIRGLRKWRVQPTQYMPQPIPAMMITSGVGGYKQQLYARDLLRAIADTVDGGR